MATHLALDRLSYWYPLTDNPALDDVSLRIGEGITAVTGPSGGGKSTLLRLAIGLVPHFHGGRIRGRATVHGHDILRTPTRLLAHGVGIVFQDPEMQTVFQSVDREIAFGLENLNTPRPVMLERVAWALDVCGAGHLRERRIATLSGGERQRVAIASVLAMRPGLLVLDEPLSQLDGAGADGLLAICQTLRDEGITILIAEHRLAGLGEIVDHRLDLIGGRAAWPDGPGISIAELPAQVLSPVAADMPIAWRCHNVAVGISTPLFETGDCSQHHGEFVALVGSNGTGKTTLLRTVAGLIPPVAGSVDRWADRIAYLPQNPGALLYRSSVRLEIETTLKRRRSADEPGDIIDAMALRDVADKYPRDLSSGQRQRAAIAAVCAGAPRLVLLDEPTRGMDTAARARLIALIRSLTQDGAAVLVATHDPELIGSAHRTLTIDGERLVDGVTPRQTVGARR